MANTNSKGIWLGAATIAAFYLVMHIFFGHNVDIFVAVFLLLAALIFSIFRRKKE